MVNSPIVELPVGDQARADRQQGVGQRHRRRRAADLIVRHVDDAIRLLDAEPQHGFDEVVAHLAEQP